MSLKEDLIAARALIDTPEKWIKGEFRNREKTAYCAIGACQEALISDDCRRLSVVFALERALPRGWESVASFNDAPRRSHGQVLALFDRAIESAS